MNKVQTLTTYHETVIDTDHLLKLHAKLREKNFTLAAETETSEFWENPETEEEVFIHLAN